MIVTLRTERIRTLHDVRAFLDGNAAADFPSPRSRVGLRLFIGRKAGCLPVPPWLEAGQEGAGEAGRNTSIAGSPRCLNKLHVNGFTKSHLR